MESLDRERKTRKHLDGIERHANYPFTAVGEVLREIYYLLKEAARGENNAPKFEAVIYSNKGDEFSSHFYILPRIGEKVKILKDKELAVEITLEVVDVIHIISRNGKSHLISMHGIER